MKKHEISKEDFDRKLEEILDGETGASLLAIPGLYEVVSEYLNNEVLAALKLEQDNGDDNDSD